MIKKSASNLVLHRNVYYFRKRVPACLQNTIGKCEVRASLQTSYLHEARVLAKGLGLRIDTIFQKLKQSRSPLMKLTDQQIQTIVAQTIQDELARTERNRLLRDMPLTNAELDNQLDVIDEVERWSREAVQRLNYSMVAPVATELLKKEGFEVDKSSLEFKKLCRELLKASIQWADTERRHTLGDYGPTQTPTAQPITIAPFQPTMLAVTKLSEAVEEYIEEKIGDGDWDSKTANNDAAKIQLFCEILDDPNAGTLSLQHIKKYKAALQRFPKNHKKMPRYRNKTVKELIQTDIPQEDRLGETTISNHFTKVKSFLIWAKTNNHIPDSDIKRVLRIKQSKNDWEFRDIFTSVELRLIFSSETLLKERQRAAFKIWVPVIALLSGMRIEEICQLHLSDIIEEDGVWCFWVNDLEEKRIKNRASARYVPIHPYLIEKLGFLQYVQQLQKSKAKRLFPKLTNKNGHGKYSASVSKWFGRYKKKLGIKGGTKGEKVFHSFRDCVAHWCETNGVEEKKAARLLGHTYGKMTFGRYSRDTAPSIMLKEVVSKIDFNIDLDHLTRSPYVPN